YDLFPLSYSEIPDFDLLKALNHGLLPRHYDSNNPQKLLSAYVGSYLEDEIRAESGIRNIQTFYRFLEKAAFSNGEILNFANIATECGISGPSVKGYFQVLIDSLLGRYVESFQKKPKRRIVNSPKFYFFDVGVANFLLKRKNIEPKSEAFGFSFEHFIFQELVAHSSYSDLNYAIRYWKTSSGLEVDFVLGDHEVIIEVKGTEQVNSRHLKGLKAFSEEYAVEKKIVISLEPFPRQMNDILVLPWKVFLDKLWKNEIIN
ncbi:MAG: ATP-binding protein, partial [Leadbetterella sp.]